MMFILKKPNSIDYHQQEIKTLHESNRRLSYINDSLYLVNTEIDLELQYINMKLIKDSIALVATQQELVKLNKQKQEIQAKVTQLTSTGVANGFEAYILSNKHH